MPLSAASKVINGTKYTYTMQPLTPATELLSLVTSLAAEPAAALASGVFSAGIKGGLESIADMDIGGPAFERVIQALLAKLGMSGPVLELVKRVNKGGTALVQGGKLAIDLGDEAVAEEFFRDRLADLVPWVTFALGRQLGPFGASVATSFGLDAANIGKVMAMAKRFVSPTASASAGASSESSQPA